MRTTQDENVDSLDAFMTNVETQMEQNKVRHLAVCISGACRRSDDFLSTGFLKARCGCCKSSPTRRCIKVRDIRAYLCFFLVTDVHVTFLGPATDHIVASRVGQHTAAAGPCRETAEDC